MRSTTLWSLAVLAGGAVAAPGYRGNWTETSCTEEQQQTTTTPTAPVYPVTTGSSSKATSSSKSASWSSASSGNSTSRLSTSAGGYGAPSTVTVKTTTYTTVCPETTTHVGGSTSISTYDITSTITETLTLTVPAVPVHTPSWSQGSPNAPGPYPSQSEGSPNGPGAYPSQSEVSPPAYETTVTAQTTVYTTVCPATTTDVWNGETSTRVYETVSTLTSTWYETITAGAGPSPSGYAPAVSGSVIVVPEVLTTVVHVTIPVSPVPTSYSPAESSSVGGGNDGQHSGSTFVTTITQTQTIIVEKTTTAVEGSSTVTKTYSGTSLHTSVYTSTCTEGAPTSWTTVQYGSTLFSYTVPLETSTSGPGGYGPGSSGKPSGSKPTGSVSGKPSPSGSISSSIRSAPSSIVSKPTQSNSRISSLPSGSFTGSKPTSSSTSTSTCTKPTPTASCVPCENQPSNDVDNHCGYTVDDNSYEVTPKTCRTVEYNFVITNGTVSPDGVDRIGFLINGQFPGPKIEANWGDTVVVHVTNNMQDNGTSIHFHGIRQFWSSEMDGVPSITQCPLAPGHSMTYTWTASSYGSSWYHSHFAIQTYGGVFGPMVIHGPATAEYDEEEMIVVQDWNHATQDSIYEAAQVQGPRTLDTGLINGLNIWGGADGAAGTTGERWSMTVVSGKRYRLRLVNTAIQSTFKFYIDNHTFKVIAMDFVPLVPYETNIVNINIGQRYDLVFTADQTPGNYWMRSDNQNACAVVTQALNIKAIVNYEGVDLATPTSTAYSYTGECVDEPLASLVPHFAMNAGASADQNIQETVAIGKPNGNYFKWTLSGTTFQSLWGEPTLNSIYENNTIPDVSGRLAIEVPNLKEWVYIIIDSPIPTPHPIHLHGHDFFVLAQGTGLYSPSVVLNTVNPPRRDVALMPYSVNPLNGGITGGYLVLAFETDNPGAWLMHCHIGWHVAMGFALQIVEAQDLIRETVSDSCQMEDTCAAWNAYTIDSVYDATVTDSGV